MTTPWNPTAIVAVDDLATAAEWNEVQQNLDHLASPPSCQAIWTANTSVANTTYTDILWGAENFDTDAFHDNTTNKQRLVVPFSGRYLIFGFLQWAAGGGEKAVRLQKNGAGGFGNLNQLPVVNAGGIIRFEDVLTLVAADYLIVQGWQNSGGALNVTGGAVTIRKISN